MLKLETEEKSFEFEHWSVQNTYAAGREHVYTYRKLRETDNDNIYNENYETLNNKPISRRL